MRRIDDLVPETSHTHVRFLRDIKQGGSAVFSLGRSDKSAVVNGPETGDDAEERALAATIRSRN